MLPEIIKQVGPQQSEYLKSLMQDLAKKPSANGAKTQDDDEDDVPPLVQGTFEDASKKWTERKPWVEILSCEIKAVEAGKPSSKYPLSRCKAALNLEREDPVQGVLIRILIAFF